MKFILIDQNQHCRRQKWADTFSQCNQIYHFATSTNMPSNTLAWACTSYVKRRKSSTDNTFQVVFSVGENNPFWYKLLTLYHSIQAERIYKIHSRKA